jgi:hypothetical protein
LLASTKPAPPAAVSAIHLHRAPAPCWHSRGNRCRERDRLAVRTCLPSRTAVRLRREIALLDRVLVDQKRRPG